MHYVKVRFTSMRRHTLSLKLLKGYLGQPYTFFLNRDSYDFVKNINSEIGQMISGTLMQFVDFASQLIQVMFLLCFLLIVDPVSTLGIGAAIGAVYGCNFVFVRRRLQRIGAERFDLNSTRSRTVSEVFWGIKDVKIFGVESVFADEYSGPSQRLARVESTSELIGDIPKFALETAAFSSIMILVLITISRTGGFQNAAASMTLYAYAGYRMIPYVQGLFKSITRLRYNAPTTQRIIREFSLVSNTRYRPGSSERMSFERKIRLDKVFYTYPGKEAPVIRDCSLVIPANSLVGFAGKTGSGKTTIVDIIIGLLIPDQGQLLIDDIPVTLDTLRSWQAQIGYVPQNIYLSDDTIAANIAVGVPKNKIDMEAVKTAASLAQVDDFVSNRLSGGYNTKVGERGICLSGGQRQRIGIARALYRNPSVLVMDEATSALDNQTEEIVMQALESLSGKKTIILIAHRLSTLKNCDVVFHMEDGEIRDSGMLNELKKRNPYFR
jgi:ABC-type bacteriocin/lantibiotic exporter with double-glycine peptidase domain